MVSNASAQPLRLRWHRHVGVVDDDDHDDDDNDDRTARSGGTECSSWLVAEAGEFIMVVIWHLQYMGDAWARSYAVRNEITRS